MTTYVAGFMFRHGGREVALIRKDHPEWQAGKLNGIGGKVKPDEMTACAMSREFGEETGVGTMPSDWREYCRLFGQDWEVYFFVHMGGDDKELRSMESEQVSWYDLGGYSVATQTIPNLKWLLPLALDKDHVHADVADNSTF